MKVRRIDPASGINQFLKDIDDRISKVETSPTGTVVVNDQIITIDPNTQVSAVFGALPDGTSGFEPYYGDTTPPNQPSTPSATSPSGVIAVTWDGLDCYGGAPPKDYDRTIIEMNTSSASATAGWSKVDELRGKGVIYVSTLSAGATGYFRLVSLDYNQNRSVPSTVVSCSVVALVDETTIANKMNSLSQQTSAAQATADSKNTAYWSNTQPTGGTYSTGDEWYDTSNNNRLSVWSGSAWTLAQDSHAALVVAQGKNQTFISATAPTASSVGDLWLDSSNGYRQNRWSGSAWVNVQDAAIGTAQSTANTAKTIATGKVTTFISATAPTASGTGDLWMDSSNGYRVNRWSGTAWVNIQDTAIAAAQTAANNAQTTANGKNKAYYQPTQPTGGTYASGDEWFNTANNYQLYVWSGSAWVLAQDSATALASSQSASAFAATKGQIWYEATAPDGGTSNGWSGTADASNSQQYQSSTLTRTNLVSNPSFETTSGTINVRTNLFTNPAATTANNWGCGSPTGLTGSTVTPMTSGGPVNGPTTYVRQSWTGGSGAGTVGFYNPSISVNASTSYAASRWVRFSQACTAKLGFDYRDSSGTVISSVYGTSVSVPANTWTLLSCIATTPSAAATIAVTGYGSGPTWASTDTSDSTGLVIESCNVVRPYFDGTNPALLRTNLAINPNFETNTWQSQQAGGGAVTITQSSSVAYIGSHSAQVSTDGTAIAQGIQILTGAVGVGTFIGSAYVKGAAGTVVYAQLRGNGSGASDTISANFTLTGGWDLISVPAITTTVGSTSLSFMIRTAGSTGVSTVFYVDAVLIEQASTVGTYFDGSTAVSPGVKYQWSGSANASPSYQLDADYTYAWASTANGSVSYQQAVGVTGLFQPDDRTRSVVYSSTAWGLSRPKSMRITPVSAQNASHGYLQFSAAANTTYTVSGTVRITAALAGSLNPYALGIWPTGTNITFTVTSQGTNAPGTYRVSSTFSVPAAGTVELRLMNGASAGNGDVWWDDIMLEQSSALGNYFDGSTPSDRTGDLWLNTSAGNKAYVWDQNSHSWIAAPDSAIASAQSTANNAQTIAQGKNTTFISATAPTASATGDIWIDTSNGYRQSRWSGSAWVNIQDTAIATAQSAANTAQSTANGKNTNYYSNTQPTGGTYKTGDIWFNTANNSQVYTYNGSSWVLTQDSHAALVTAQGKNQTFISATAPTASAVGDIWIDTSNGNRQSRWDGSSWVNIQDSAIATAQTAANNAQTTANGKNTTFISATAPTASAVGDIWIDTSNGNRQSRWDGSSWVNIQDSAIATAQTAANNAQTTANGRITTFIQNTAPTANAAGDLWLDSGNGYRMNRWSGSAWVNVQDAAIANAQSTANSAQTSANGKNTVTYSTSAASGSGTATGDTWFQTDASGNVIAMWSWSGSAWVTQAVGNQVIAALDAGKITTGYLNAARIQAGTITASMIATDTITASQIAAGAITSSELAAGSVTAAKLTANAVMASAIAANTITSSQIAADTITSGNIAAGAITASELAANAVTASAIAANTITASQIAANTITAGQIAAGTITASQMAANTITATNGIIASIDASKISTGYINAARIQAGTITADKLVIGDMENWVVDPYMTGVGTIGGATYLTAANTSVSAGAPYTKIAQLNSRDNVESPAQYRPATGGDIFYVEFWTIADSTATINIGPGLWVQTDDGTNSWITGTTVTPAQGQTGWQKLTATLTVPSSVSGKPVTKARAWIQIPGTSGTNTNGWYITGWITRRQNGTTTIANGAITTNQIAADTITSGNIAAGAITASELAANSVTASAIKAGTITASQIAANTITGGLIAANTITASNIAANTITAGQIAANTITASQMAANSITSQSIATGAVTAGAIVAGAVTSQALAANSVTATAIAANTITASQIAANTITAGQIAAGAITASELAANSVSASAIVANSITASALAANAITASAISAGAIGATQLAAHAVTASAIAANTIVAGNGIVQSLDAGTISTGYLNAARINSKTITSDKLVIGSTDNLISEPTFAASGTSWNLGTGMSIDATGSRSGTTALKIANNNTQQGSYNLPSNLPTSASAAYRQYAWIKSDVAIPSGGVSLYAKSVDVSGNYTTTQVVSSPSVAANAWYMLSGAYVVPDNAVGVSFGIFSEASFSTGNVWVDSVFCARMSNGELVVDGSITSTAIAASAITGNKISAGAIDGMVITGATIQTAHSGARIVLDSSALNAWDASGTNYLNVTAASGVQIVGKVSAQGKSSNNININASLGPNLVTNPQGTWNSPGLAFIDMDNPLSHTAGIFSDDGQQVTITQGSVAQGSGGGTYLTLGRDAMTLNAYQTITIASNTEIDLLPGAGPVKVGNKKLMIGHARYKSLNFGQQGGMTMWDVGVLSVDTSNGNYNQDNDFCQVGSVNGSIQILVDGFYSFTGIMIPPSSMGSGWMRIYNTNTSTVLAINSNGGINWELYVATGPIFIPANTTLRFQTEVQTTVNGVNSYIDVHRHNF